MPSSTTPSVGVVLPVRSFRGAFTRLDAVLTPGQRATLARILAEQVADACTPLPVVVVSSDPEVVAWAEARGIVPLEDPGSLSGAARSGQEYWAAHGVDRVAVVHADLHRMTSLSAALAESTPVVLVPCHRNDGTPVMIVPASPPFPFAYGPGSFALHHQSADTAGLEVAVVTDPDLGADLDTPEDFATLATTLTAALS